MPYLSELSHHGLEPARRSAHRMTTAWRRVPLADVLRLVSLAPVSSLEPRRLRCSADDIRTSPAPPPPRWRRNETHARPAERLRAGLQRGGARRGLLRAHDRGAGRLRLRADHRQRRLDRRARRRSSTASPMTDPRLRIVHLSRNFGHQAALTAGLEHARGDAVAMLDADLQDPPRADRRDGRGAGRSGADVVYMVREQREGETRFKLATARAFYSLFRQASRRSTSSPTPATSACSTGARSTRCCRWASATASCAG